jgi:hypothetical protein
MIELGFSSYRSLYFAFAAYFVFGQIALWLEFHPFKVNKSGISGLNPDPRILQCPYQQSYAHGDHSLKNMKICHVSS